MRFMTIAEAARLLGIPEQRLRRGVEAGRYPYVQIGHRKLVDMDELEPIIRAERATIGIREAAQLTGLPETAIRRGAREGWLPCRKDGKAYIFQPEQLLAALERMKIKR